MQSLIFLSVIALGLSAGYHMLRVWLPGFFNQPVSPESKSRPRSFAIVSGLSAAAYLVSFQIPDPELANRFLHAIGGGVVASAAFYFAARDSFVRLSALQYFVASFLVVTALGVGNEIMEFTFQSIAPFVFAETVQDTWLDLASNTIGAAVAGALLMSGRHRV